MKLSWTLGTALLLGSVLLFPQTADAEELYKREGGQAFHVRRDCPALSGYNVEKITSIEGLAPCRVCDAQAFSQRQAQKAAADKKQSSNTAHVKSLQEMSGTAYEKDNSSEKQPQNAQVVYPPDYWDENNKLHADPNGAFIVNNGQKVYVNGQQHNAGGAGVTVGGSRPAGGRRR